MTWSACWPHPSQVVEGPGWRITVLTDRLLRNILTDVTGNTHRAEICIVAADGQEIHLLEELTGGKGEARCLQHRADFEPRGQDAVQPRLSRHLPHQNLARFVEFARIGNEGEHDAERATCRRATIRSARARGRFTKAGPGSSRWRTGRAASRRGRRRA